MSEESEQEDLKQSKLSTTDKLDVAFAKERKEISGYIKENITDKMHSIDEIANLQVHILSQRQRLVDKTNGLRASIRKKNQNMARVRKQKYRFYKTEFDVKLNDYEITRHIDADVEEANNMVKILENQIQYYKDTTDTLDKCTFMIKYLIDVKKFMSGGF
jgi:hypothetical protein